MGDKDALKQMQEKVRKALGWQEKIRAITESAATEKEERERQEQG